MPWIILLSDSVVMYTLSLILRYSSDQSQAKCHGVNLQKRTGLEWNSITPVMDFMAVHQVSRSMILNHRY